MHSKGIRKRRITHPILQDGYELILLLKQRRWRCNNPDCGYSANEEFRFVDNYFPNAIPVVDSFHVVQWIIHAIDMYIRELERNFRKRDREIQDKKSAEFGCPVTLPLSNEIYILKKYRWLILSNQKNIRYHSDARMDPHFRRLMNTYDYEYELFRISPRLRDLRDLKEMYVCFNERNAGHPMQAKEALKELIDHYFHRGDSIFIDFADLLCRYKDPIIHSFVMVEKHGPGGIYDSRLSNGPIESLNRKIKDLKRLGRGFRNFEHFRNRFLYATRNRPVLNGSSEHNQVQYFEEEEVL